ncbi:hypothetical protein FISHEDRAFT_66458 [Fistulina hepatica ATCC 64428]|uniref:Mitochondrial outer membrane protein IML2 n=1 Tax=Fistulina hepatica ATCC 64428 TaxID=1128425 RepID=A0A0D7A6V8_9AGAR|nr:hypothetical protein FISHEDRAFT_66458 [Fistulina hepatica ATCC 64428]
MADTSIAALASATQGFDHIFSNDIQNAKSVFASASSPYHSLGLGACTFLEAALGMETNLMADASRRLSDAESGAKREAINAKKSKKSSSVHPGLEWEVVASDATLLLGLTHALSETYVGYLQCIANSKFAKLYKAVFPHGLDGHETTVNPHALSRALSGSTPNLLAPPRPRASLFGLWGVRGEASPVSAIPTPVSPITPSRFTSSVDELIHSGTAFGYGLFNLVFSLLPRRLRSVVGLFGYKHDRKLALRALAVSSRMGDIHGVFAGLVLMTYYGVVLLLSGYQAQEARILREYGATVDRITARYPEGALWILNRAKILRMAYHPDAAITVLQDGLSPQRQHTFKEADMMLIFELAWTLLSQRRYAESAEMFMRITEVNSWSHATYYFIAGGCFVALANEAIDASERETHIQKAQSLFDAIPQLIAKRKISGKDLPTEVFIKKQLQFYKDKQRRRSGDEKEFARAMSISPCEAIGIFWNTHTRISRAVAEAHLKTWTCLTPLSDAPEMQSSSSAAPDLDTPDERALGALLMGIVYRTIKDIKVSTWTGGVACFELAVLELKECESRTRVRGEQNADARALWKKAVFAATAHLDTAYALATHSVDLSSRLDSRIEMLRDEIGSAKEKAGL